MVEVLVPVALFHTLRHWVPGTKSAQLVVAPTTRPPRAVDTMRLLGLNFPDLTSLRVSIVSHK